LFEFLRFTVIQHKGRMDSSDYNEKAGGKLWLLAMAKAFEQYFAVAAFTYGPNKG
jgi:hypothetical protein